jgi:hypothetical protein
VAAGSLNKKMEKPGVFTVFPQKVLKRIMFSLLVEIAAAVDEEPGEPGEVVDGGTKN